MSYRFLFVKHGLVSENAPGCNGVGRFVPQLARVTIKFCKEKGSSSGVRHYIENHIVPFAERNPGTAVYLKPRRNRSPVLVAEYLNGERHWQSLDGLSSVEVRGWVELASTASGREFQHQTKHHHTLHPSVQGMWHSYVNTDPAVAAQKFPSSALSTPTYREKTATERLQEIFDEQQRLKQERGGPADNLSPDEDAALAAKKQSEQ